MFSRITNRALSAAMMHPGAAVTESLAVVMVFTGLLGLVFLPKEARRLNPRQHVSVTHFLPPRESRPGVSLFWSIPQTGIPGWRHHLALNTVNGPRVVQLAADMQPLSIAAGPSDSQVFIGNWDGAIYSLDPHATDAKAELIARQATGGVTALVCSQDGRHLLSQDAFHLHCWNLDTRELVWRRPDLHATCFSPLPYAAAAIVASSAGELLEIDLSNGRTLATRASLGTPIFAAAFSPNAQQLAVVLATGRLVLFDSHTFEIVWENPSGWHTASGRFVGFSPSGRTLVTTDPDSSRCLAVWDLAKRQRAQQLVGHEGIVLGAQFTEDGLLHSWGTDGTVRSWNLASGASLTVAALAPPRNASG